MIKENCNKMMDAIVYYIQNQLLIVLSETSYIRLCMN